ncbi:MAG: hypothetical protein RJAPGHWK_001981 [Candidatus Fervidibacter sp.]
MGELDKQWREDKQQPPMLRDLLSLPTETTRLIGDGSPNDAPYLFTSFPWRLNVYHLSGAHSRTGTRLMLICPFKRKRINNLVSQ